MKQYLTMSQAAALSGVNRNTMRLAAHSGRLEAQRIAGRWVTTAEAVARYVPGKPGRPRRAK